MAAWPEPHRHWRWLHGPVHAGSDPVKDSEVTPGRRESHTPAGTEKWQMQLSRARVALGLTAGHKAGPPLLSSCRTHKAEQGGEQRPPQWAVTPSPQDPGRGSCQHFLKDSFGVGVSAPTQNPEVGGIPTEIQSPGS